jgi:uncharacterized protein (TIGR03437 family)
MMRIRSLFGNVFAKCVCSKQVRAIAPAVVMLAAFGGGSASGQSYIISTIAGTGTQGYSGDGGPATSAELSSPNGIAIDSSGNIYIADAANHRVRKISGGTISTFAGNGTPGFSGDTAAATSAELDGPTDVAVDSSGNVYIADTQNNVVRIVNSAGIINTFAGDESAGAGYSGDTGTAINAQLNAPSGLAIDSKGNVYIADSLNGSIRIVTPAVAATSTAPAVAATINTYLSNVLNHPDKIVIDKAGDMFISDTDNRRIVEYSAAAAAAATGTVTVFAGNESPGYSGDNGPATSAMLNDPTGIALDAAGDLFICDTFNYRVRVVSGGIISTVAGNGHPGYYGDGGPATAAYLFFPRVVAVDSSGNVYVGDTQNGVVRKLQPTSATIAAVASAASFVSPVSPGSLATIAGSNMAAAKLQGQVPLRTTLGGISVEVNGQAAPLLYVSPTTVNFQVPWETATGNATVTINGIGVTSNTYTVPVIAAAPGIFQISASQGAIENQDFSLNTPTNPAAPNSTIVVYLTGTGPLNPPVPDGAATPLSPYTLIASSNSASIGGVSAQVTFAGMTPGSYGLGQMNIVVPSLKAGTYPLVITINGQPSNAVNVTVN